MQDATHNGMNLNLSEEGRYYDVRLNFKQKNYKMTIHDCKKSSEH